MKKSSQDSSHYLNRKEGEIGCPCTIVSEEEEAASEWFPIVQRIQTRTSCSRRAIRPRRTSQHVHKQHAHTQIPTIYSVAAHRISPDARQLRQLEWPSSRRRATQPWPNRLTILSQREWLRLSPRRGHAPVRLQGRHRSRRRHTTTSWPPGGAQ